MWSRMKVWKYRQQEISCDGAIVITVLVSQYRIHSMEYVNSVNTNSHIETSADVFAWEEAYIGVVKFVIVEKKFSFNK